MNIGVIGLNQKHSSLSLREAFLKECEKSFEKSKIHDDHSFVVLSTCNRVEIYFSSEDLTVTHSYLLSRLNRCFEQHVYSFFKQDAFRHLLRVVCGLDSAILGETEIQGQVKTAYERAHLSKGLPKPLHFLFQKALKVGKWMRSHFIFKNKNTLLESLIELGGETLLKKRTLFVGASQINKILIKELSLKGANLTVCNRTDVKGEVLSEKFGLSFLPWQSFPLWEEFDTVILGTKATNPLILNYEGTKPIQIFDLSVPRNVSFDLKEHPYVKLYQIDELQALVKSDSKETQTEKIEQLINYEACRYTALFEEKQILCSV
jgi:glutamyl-tRNA reductase